MTLDEIWIECARQLDIPVARGGDAYVHFDGWTLFVAGSEHLDHDDTLAQLILHELCHLAVQGPAMRHVPDWGLDNTNDRDEDRERATIRLQAHLTGKFGVRGALFPTTPQRVFYESLGEDALGRADDPDPSCALALLGATRVGRWPFSAALDQALRETARALGVPFHGKSGHALLPEGDERVCGGCVWRTEGGECRQAVDGEGEWRRARVSAGERACVRHEVTLDCFACGACCRSGFDVVPVGPRDRVRKRHPELVVAREHDLVLLRNGDRCAALAGEQAGPYTCRIYEDRPRVCRDLAPGGSHCLTARWRVGLSP